MSFTIPDSPSLPEFEKEAPEDEIPKELSAQLNLEDDDDDDDDDMEMDMDMNQDKNGEVVSKREKDVLSEDSSYDDMLLNNPLSCSIPKDKNYVPSLVDFSDPNKPDSTSLNPFGDNIMLFSSDPIPIQLTTEIQPLSDSQEQKLIDYIENKILVIQNGFIKYLSAKNDASLPDHGLKFCQVILKIDEILEFIWFAITKCKGNLPIIYHSKILQEKNSDGMKLSTLVINEKNVLQLPKNLKNSMFISFLIRLSGDLIDYISKYSLQLSDYHILLKLLSKFDNFYSILIDYSNLSLRKLISNTEKIRLNSIIQRTKILVITVFENHLPNLDKSTLANDIEHIQVGIGQTFEGVLDRTSI